MERHFKRMDIRENPLRVFCLDCGDRIVEKNRKGGYWYYVDRKDGSAVCGWCKGKLDHVRNERKKVREERERELALENCGHNDCQVISWGWDGQPKEVECKFCKRVNYL